MGHDHLDHTLEYSAAGQARPSFIELLEVDQATPPLLETPASYTFDRLKHIPEHLATDQITSPLVGSLVTRASDCLDSASPLPIDPRLFSTEPASTSSELPDDNDWNGFPDDDWTKTTWLVDRFSGDCVIELLDIVRRLRDQPCSIEGTDSIDNLIKSMQVPIESGWFYPLMDQFKAAHGREVVLLVLLCHKKHITIHRDVGPESIFTEVFMKGITTCK